MCSEIEIGDLVCLADDEDFIAQTSIFGVMVWG